MKVKHGVENGYLDTFHELMNAGISEEEQVYLFHHGLRNRLCLHAVIDYMRIVGVSITDDHLRTFVKSRRDDIKEYLMNKGYPAIVFEKIERWIFKK